MIAALASATPSTTPIVTMLAPSTEAMNTGSRLCTSSEEMSMNREPNPSAQMPTGSARKLCCRGIEDGLTRRGTLSLDRVVA